MLLTQVAPNHSAVTVNGIATISLASSNAAFGTLERRPARDGSIEIPLNVRKLTTFHVVFLR